MASREAEVLYYASNRGDTPGRKVGDMESTDVCKDMLDNTTNVTAAGSIITKILYLNILPAYPVAIS